MTFLDSRCVLEHTFLQPFGRCYPSDTFRQRSLLCLNSGLCCLHHQHGLLRGLPVHAGDVINLSGGLLHCYTASNSMVDLEHCKDLGATMIDIGVVS